MSSDNMRLHKALIASSAAHKKYSMQEFQRLNLSTGQPKVLSILYEKEGYLQKELALLCHVEPATMTSLLNKMIENDMIYKNRELVSGGKRAYSIHLTEKGRELANQVNQIVHNVENISFQGFHESEKLQLIEFLKRIQLNLENPTNKGDKTK